MSGLRKQTNMMNLPTPNFKIQEQTVNPNRCWNTPWCRHDVEWICPQGYSICSKCMESEIESGSKREQYKRIKDLKNETI